jgi:hypothetical protein
MRLLPKSGNPYLMSELTKTVLDAAIADHYADEMDGAIVSGWVLQVVGGSLDDYDQGQQCYYRSVQEGQSFLMTLGLAHFMAVSLDAAVLDD